MKRGVNPDLGLAILRVVVGVIFIAHGAPKLFGGIDQTGAFFASLGIPIPVAAAWAIGALEFVGGMALVAGFLISPTALLLAAEMLAGVVLFHAARGFYVVGPEANQGLEFNLILLASLLMLVFGGPGLAAMDARKSSI